MVTTEAYSKLIQHLELIEEDLNLIRFVEIEMIEKRGEKRPLKNSGDDRIWQRYDNIMTSIIATITKVIPLTDQVVKEIKINYINTEKPAFDRYIDQVYIDFTTHFNIACQAVPPGQYEVLTYAEVNEDQITDITILHGLLHAKTTVPHLLPFPEITYEDLSAFNFIIIQKEYNYFISEHNTLLDTVANMYDNENSKTKVEKSGNLITEDTLEVTEFSELFNKISQYHHIMKILADRGDINRNTKVWINQEKGNKGFLIAIIRHLRAEGYFKKAYSGKQSQKIYELYEKVISKSFGIQIDIETIKERAGQKKYDTSFILPASTIP